MTNENYQPCPCGSGKKIKFCKCIDQPQEYEKLVKLMAGDQSLAAMDRINQLLAKTPNAAWLLAIKAEVSLRLNEIETFKETVGKFYKLKPDNPLALLMRSLVSFSEEEPVAEGVRFLLEGLAESRESVHPIALNSLQFLCVRLRESPSATLRHFWLELLEHMSNQEIDVQQVDPGALDDSVLTKAHLVVEGNLNGQPWNERAQEVSSLTATFRYGQAETKLRSILRDYPDQVWPLQKLLEVQMVLVDQEGALATARKLSGLRELDEQSRDYFAALAMELEPNKRSLAPELLTRYVEIESESAARDALAQIDGLWLMPHEDSREMAEMFAALVKDEVPAQDIYVVHYDMTLSDGATCECHCGIIALFGRQTDRPPRALVELTPTPSSQEKLDKIMAALAPKSDLPLPIEIRRSSYVEIASRPVREKRNSDQRLTLGQQGEAAMQILLSLRLGALENLTLAEAADQEPKRALVRALLTHLESCQDIYLPPGTIRNLYQRLQVTWPETDLMTLESAPARSLLSLLRCDLTKATDEQLLKLFITYDRLRMGRARIEAAREVINRGNSPQLAPARLGALQLIIPEVESPEEVLPLLNEIEQLQVARKMPVGETVLRTLSTLREMGREMEARQYMEQALRKYPDDPVLINFIQRISQMQRQQSRGLDEVAMLQRMSSRRVEPEAEPQSSLVLPGQASDSQPGKSKLWLPGS